MKLINIWRHFYTITQHKAAVARHCFQVGMYWQGLTHDLSKYTPAEFWQGCRYYQGFQSPNNAEREAKGYSSAWLHHKGRNKHHYEYWIDYSLKPRRCMAGMKMPLRYVNEMIMDRIAASRVYKGKDYTDGSAWEYYQREQPYLTGVMHPRTKEMLEYILLMLKDQGERKTFAYLRKLLRKGDY